MDTVRLAWALRMVTKETSAEKILEVQKVQASCAIAMHGRVKKVSDRESVTENRQLSLVKSCPG
jgi:hypothetical protein